MYSTKTRWERDSYKKNSMKDGLPEKGKIYRKAGGRAIRTKFFVFARGRGRPDHKKNRA